MKFKKISVLVLCCFLMFNLHAYASNSFNPSSVYNTIKELTSEKYAGRLAGDKGNKLAADYIASYFNNLKLTPGGDNKTYFQSFEAYVPTLNGKCYFKILDSKGSTIKEYSYGTDFKEVPYGASIPGTVNGNLKFDDSSKGSILLLQDTNIGESPSDYKMDMTLKNQGTKAIIYPTNRNFRFRSPYKLQSEYSDGLVKIMVSKDIVPELVEYSKKNYKFEIKSTLETKNVVVNNVIGILEGKDNSLPPVILSAHFDHVGYDADGVIYPGALDNASGTAFLMECARVLKSTPNFDRTVIFAAFNAEEEGLIGSEYFVKNPTVNIKNAECINFDMVGSLENIPLSVLSLPSKAEFSNTIANIVKNCSIEVKMLYEDNSDHAPFCSAGFNSVTLIHDDMTRIHTPSDTIKNIDKDRLEDVFLALNSYLKSKDIVMASTYPSDKSPYLLYSITTLAIVSLALAFIYYRRKRVSKNW
jgi:aminopeptidase YwaD